MAPIPYRTPEETLPEFPSAAMQEFFDPPETEMNSAEADAPHLEPRAPAHTKRAPLPHAPREKELPSRHRDW